MFFEKGTFERYQISVRPGRLELMSELTERGLKFVLLATTSQ
jgi:hypothetical protein